MLKANACPPVTSAKSSKTREIDKAMLYISGQSLRYTSTGRGSAIGIVPHAHRLHQSVIQRLTMITSKRGERHCRRANGRFFNMRTIEDDSTPLRAGFQMILQLRFFTPTGADEPLSATIMEGDRQRPILANNEFDGEEYDARKELTAGRPGLTTATVERRSDRGREAPLKRSSMPISRSWKRFRRNLSRDPSRHVRPRHGAEHGGWVSMVRGRRAIG